jgi:hypothetical protein
LSPTLSFGSLFVVGIAATWAAKPLPVLIKNSLLWLPRKAWGEILDYIKEAPKIRTMQADPRTAAPYVGFNLARLMTNLFVILLLAGFIGLYQITDATWSSKWHVWAVVVASIVIVANGIRWFKHFVFIWLAYRAFFDPPKTLVNLKPDAKDAAPQQTAAASEPRDSQTGS